MAITPCVRYHIVVVALEILIIFAVIGNSRLISKNEERPPHEHTIKTIKTRYGDIYDCVDFYKQPSLNHPSLKNHNFYPEMLPSKVPKFGENLSQDKENSILNGTISMDGTCPKGTVPIRRSPKHGASTPITSLPYLQDINNSNYDRPGTFYAIAQTKFNQSKAYYGVGAYIKIYKAKVHESVEYSSAEIIIKSSDTDSIVVGWTVNPSVYHDNLTRLFVYTVVQDQACFNAQCKFVSTRPDFPPDVAINRWSTRGGPESFVLRLLIFMDQVDQNWWLMVHDQVIGFWPWTGLSSLQAFGSYVACGGEVYFPNTSSWAVPPDMGCGYKPTQEGLEIDNSYCSNFTVVTGDNSIVDVDNTEEYVNKPEFYRVWDKGYTGDNLGHVVLFGGPFEI